MLSLLLIGLAELFLAWPKWSKTAFLDRSIVKAVASGDVQTGTDGEYTISDTVTESVWTLRTLLVCSLLGLSVFFALLHRDKVQ